MRSGCKSRDLEFVRQNALAIKLNGASTGPASSSTPFSDSRRCPSRISCFAAFGSTCASRGGKLWLDVFFPDIERLARPHSSRLEPDIFYVHALDRTVYRDTEIRPERASQTQHVSFNYRWFNDAGEETPERVDFGLTWLFPREMQMLLERNGFAVEAMYGDYDGSKVTDRSPRMIVVARLAK